MTDHLSLLVRAECALSGTLPEAKWQFRNKQSFLYALSVLTLHSKDSKSVTLVLLGRRSTRDREPEESS